MPDNAVCAWRQFKHRVFFVLQKHWLIAGNMKKNRGERGIAEEGGPFGFDRMGMARRFAKGQNDAAIVTRQLFVCCGRQRPNMFDQCIALT